MTPEPLLHQPTIHPKRRTRLAVGGLLATAFLLFALPALRPFLQLGLTLSADGMLHVLRTALLAIHQQEGVFYPRWMPDLVLGYGYPLLSFYGPATYYLASFFVLLGADPALALLLTFVALLLLAGVGAYLLVYDLADEAEGWRRRAAAMVGAVAYLYAPYLLINVYARGAVAEVGAQMLLPWMLLFLRRIFYAANPTPAALGFALSTALLAVTHNISLIFMPPVIALYGLAVIWQARELPWPVRKRVGVAALAGAAALGVSAFFWAPLLLERANLAATAFAIAARYVGENTWTWSNFLDVSFPFEYSTAIPFQLGAVQVILAAVGFVMLPRRTAEWWALLAIALAASLMISAWALPLWLNSDVLLIAQFPWRLLAVASLPLAVFPAGIVLRVQLQWAALAISLALIGVIIASQRPTATAFTPLLNQPVAIGQPATAQFEFQTNAYGASSSSEFLPRWVGPNLFGDADANATPALRPEIHLEMASPVVMKAVITTTAPTDLHATNFYFPGWSATIDGRPAALRPDPARGMQTLTAPAGVHHIVISGTGTPLQQAATSVSLFTLAALAVGVWLRGERQRWLAAVPTFCLLVGLFAMLQPPPRPAEWRSVNAPVGGNSLELLGYRHTIEEGRLLHLFPTWFVHAPTAGSLHWQLVDAAGRAATEVSGDAFFNTLRLASIPAATIFDDAYQLALPPNLAAGEYTLRAGVSAAGEPPAFVTVGALRLPDIPATSAPAMHSLDLRFGEAVLLDGWNARVDGRAAPDAATMLVLRPGQVLEYTLFWRADRAVDENYHGFVHLLDHTQQAVRQHDKTAGSLLAPSRLWNAFYTQPDTYRFVIDDAMPGGLYRPTVGLYRFTGDGQRLPITDAGGQPLGAEIALPAVKVLARPDAAPVQQVNVRLGDWGELQGFSVAPDTTTAAPGDVVTLTLIYEASAPAPVDYTRFIHMHSPALGMAAQQDAPPLNSGNPTTTWVAGEQIVETVALQIALDAQPGEYTVWFGMYDPANGERAPLRSASAEPLADNWLSLMTLSVRDERPR
jgi:hypothetical protein